MNSTVRILSVAAAAAFTALGAQASANCMALISEAASSPPAAVPVQAEAAQAVTQFKNFVAVESNTAPSIVERASVRPRPTGGTPAPDRHWRPQLIVSRTSRVAIRHRAP